MISEGKLTELLNSFKENESIIVIDLYNHVSKLYNKDKESFLKDIEINISKDEKILELDSISDKPLGKLGDITVNEMILKAKELKWETYIHNAHLTLNVVPTVMNFVSYSLILRGYMKYVHNRPYNPNLNNIQRGIQENARNRQLALFTIFGSPFVLFLLNNASVGVKNMGSIEFNIDNTKINQNIESNSNLKNNNYFLIFLGKITKRIPK
jgi:hypothetical protein